jgi:hypothetical protein
MRLIYLLQKVDGCHTSTELCAKRYLILFHLSLSLSIYHFSLSFTPSLSPPPSFPFSLPTSPLSLSRNFSSSFSPTYLAPGNPKFLPSVIYLTSTQRTYRVCLFRPLNWAQENKDGNFLLLPQTSSL